MKKKSDLPCSVSFTVRLPVEAMDRLDQEIVRLKASPKWKLLTVNRNAVVRWAIEHWVKTAMQSPAGLFLDDDHSSVDLEGLPEVCDLCDRVITDARDRTEVVLLGERRVYHSSCKRADCDHED